MVSAVKVFRGGVLFLSGVVAGIPSLSLAKDLFGNGAPWYGWFGWTLSIFLAYLMLYYGSFIEKEVEKKEGNDGTQA